MGGRASKGEVADVGNMELVAGRWKLGEPSLPQTHTCVHCPFSFSVRAAVGQTDYQEGSRIARFRVTCSAESGWNPETCNGKVGRTVRILYILDRDGRAVPWASGKMNSQSQLCHLKICVILGRLIQFIYLWRAVYLLSTSVC